MKPLLVLARIAFVGGLWSIIFIEGVRVIMLENLRFDIFWFPHWLHAWNLWLSGWVIDTPKEWAFILLIFTFLPLWLTGWIALSLVAWEALACKGVMCPINAVRALFNPLRMVVKTPTVVKKKSYKEIRPSGPRAPIYDYADNTTGIAPMTPSMSSIGSNANATSGMSGSSSGRRLKDKATSARETFSHSLFNLDDEDDDFDLDFSSFEKSDIFKVNKKEKPASSEPSASKNSFSFDDDGEDEKPQRQSYETKKGRRNDDEDKPRRKSFDDDDDVKPRNRREDKDSRDDRRDNKKDNRRDDKRRNDRSENDERRKDRNARDKNENKDGGSSKETGGSAPRGNNPVFDVLSQKGYDVITGATIKNTIVDFIGVAEDKICLCLVDKEIGDWLADEERFNDEEPLWFSESSHRISPVRKAGIARQALLNKLENSEFKLDVDCFVIVQMGNIINAEDMFDVWGDLNVEVTRINRGSPKELKLFSKTLEDADVKLEKTQLDSIKKLIRNMS